MRACPPMLVRKQLPECFSLAIDLFFLSNGSISQGVIKCKHLFYILFPRRAGKPAGEKNHIQSVRGSRMVTTVPPPSALPIWKMPLWSRTISSQTARPMPLPRALDEPL